MIPVPETTELTMDDFVDTLTEGLALEPGRPSIGGDHVGHTFAVPSRQPVAPRVRTPFGGGGDLWT